MRRTLAAVAGALLSLVAIPAPAVAKRPLEKLQLLGQAVVPTGTVYPGTTVGGLSSIIYDQRYGVFYALSDDPVSSSRLASTPSGSTYAMGA